MQTRTNLKAMLALTLLIGSLSLLSGCGGTSSGTPSPVNGGTTGENGMITGTAVKGPISGGTVTAYAISNGTMGTPLASGTTDTQGNFSMSLGSYSGPVMLQISGGTYIDEATGLTMTMSPGDVMTSVMTVLSSGATVTGIQVTPLTSMAQAMAQNMAGGMTGTNITAANTSVGDYFMVHDILHTQPMNPLVSGSSNTATQDMRNYGMAIAAMTQYAADMGMTSSSGMVTSLMNDASDGIMDGMTGTNQITMGGMTGGGTMMQPAAGTSGLTDAMTQFMQSSMNKSGLTLSDMQTLMGHLGSSNGQFQGIGGMMSGGTGTGGMMTGETGTGGIVTNGTGTGGMMTGVTGTGGIMTGGTVTGGMMNGAAGWRGTNRRFLP